MRKWHPVDNSKYYLSDDDWYKYEAVRSVNQSIGRVIRHHKDYGVLVLADERFDKIKSLLPKWVTNNQQIVQRYAPKFSTTLDHFLGKEEHKEADMRRVAPIKV